MSTARRDDIEWAARTFDTLAKVIVWGVAAFVVVCLAVLLSTAVVVAVITGRPAL